MPRRWTPSGVAAVLFGTLFVLCLYLLLAGRGKGDTVNVTVREGPPQLGDGQNALITLRGSLLEELLETGIQEANLPFKIADIDVTMEETGLRISGRAATSVLSFPVSAKFSGMVHPNARDDGSIGVQVTNVRAATGKLPSVFEPALEAVINAELNEATRIEGFKVRQVEVGNDELLVYLHFAPDELPLGGAFRP